MKERGSKIASWIISNLSRLGNLSYLIAERSAKRLKIGPQVGRKTVVATVALALVVTTFPLAAFLTAQPAKAAWYNNDWHYRKSILFTHTAAESNVYLNLSGANALDTSASGKFQSDCGDLRFTDSAGKIMPYYLVSGCGTSVTVAHVLFGSMPAGDQYLYVYYGNPSVANGTTSFDFSTAATGITFGSVGAEETSQGPVGEWKFDEGYGTAAHDSSTNGNTGTLTNGPTWQSQDMCVSGKCLYFNSSGSSYMQAAAAQSVTQNQFSATAWFRTTNTIADMKILSGDSGLHPLGVYHGTVRTCENTCAAGSTNVGDGKWHFVALVSSGSSASLYLDGSNKPEATASATTSTVSDIFRVGSQGAGSGAIASGFYFSGFIDDPSLYTYAISQAQVQQVYAKGLTSMNQQQGNLSNGLVGYWKMDEASWNGTSGEVKDSSGGGNNGQATCFGTSCTLPTTGLGKFANGGFFNGTDQRVKLPATSSLNFQTNGSFTIALWANPATLSSAWRRGVIVDENYLTSGYRFGFDNGGKPRLWTTESGGSFEVPSSAAMQLNAWNLIVVTYNNQQARMYLNGTLTGTATGTYIAGSTSPQIAMPVSENFSGTLDDIRMYGRALSSSEVGQLYNFGPPPVAAYNFEEGSGTTVNDVSGNGNTGTWNGTATHWAASTFGTAGDFNGQDNFVRAVDSASLDSLASFTAGAWIKTSEQRQGNFIVQKIDGFSFNGWLLALDSGGHISARVADASTYASFATTTVVPVGSWHYVSVSFSAPNNLNIYYDGTLAGTFSPSKNITATNRPLSIGTTNWRGSGTNYDFSGKIDEVKIYNYARSQTQVLQDMNGSVSALDSPVGYWKMDEGQGTTIHNSGIGGTALDGTVSNTTWTTAGKNGNALNFTTASVSKVDVGASVPVAATNPISVSAWINMADFGQYHSIFSLDFDFVGQKGLWLAVDPSSVTSKLFVEIGNGSGIYKYTSMIPPLNTWIQYSVVYDPINARLTQYVNGQVVRADAGVPQVVLAATHSAIGNDYIRGLSFNGKLDDVKVWDAALTSQDILADYNRAVSVKSGSPGTENVTTKSGATSAQPSNTKGSEYCVPGDTSACAGPVGEWKFEEGTGSSAKDTSGNGYDMTYAVAAPAVTYGKFGKALAFDGTSTSMVSSNSSAGALANTLTVEAWIKPTISVQPYNPAEIVAKTSAAYYYRLELLSGNVIRFRTFGPTNDSLTTAAAVPINQWTHIVATYDGSTKQIYINGQLSASVAATGAMNTFGDVLNIGGFNGGNRSVFQGAIDQVRLFGYARTPAQVAWDYNKGGPVAQYKMDECSGTTIHDASGNGLNGTLNLGSSGVTAPGTCQTSGTAWGNGSSGKINSSMSFDGVDDYVRVTKSSALMPTQALSVSVWINAPATEGTNARIVSIQSTQNIGYDMEMNAGKPSLNIAPNGTRTATSGATSLLDNKWHHLLGVWDGTNAMLYVDGKLAKTTNGATGQIVYGTVDLLIGANNSGLPANFYTGQIDDVQIFNYALTPLQVAVLYNGGSVRWGP